MNRGCLITARKGSKRFLGKNKAILADKTLFGHTLHAAISSQIFSTIVVSSDDEDIISEASQFASVLIHRRPPELATSNITVWQVLNSLLEIDDINLQSTDTITVLTPCHPFRCDKDIIQSNKQVDEKKADSLISISEYPCPPDFALQVKDNYIVKNWPGLARIGDKPISYHPNGAIIILNTQYYIRTREIYSEKTLAYEMQWPWSLDIDYEKDLLIARQLYDCVKSVRIDPLSETQK